MKSIQSEIKEFIASKNIEFVERNNCPVCESVNSLLTIKVNGAIKEQCNRCEDIKLIKKMNIPTAEEYERSKEVNFAKRFERITNDLVDATVNSYKADPKYPTQEKVKQAAVDFITKYDGTQSLVLAGVPGIGKSHLSYAINKAIRSKGYKTLFIKSTDLLDAIKETYNYQSNITQEQIFRMIDELDLLVLDDLGGEYEKRDNNQSETWASDVLYKTVDMRLGKSLIVTTNYSESELTTKYGQVQGSRIVSRMMENATAIRVKGADLRRKERF